MDGCKCDSFLFFLRAVWLWFFGVWVYFWRFRSSVSFWSLFMTTCMPEQAACVVAACIFGSSSFLVKGRTAFPCYNLTAFSCSGSGIVFWGSFSQFLFFSPFFFLYSLFHPLSACFEVFRNQKIDLFLVIIVHTKLMSSRQWADLSRLVAQNHFKFRSLNVQVRGKDALCTFSVVSSAGKH